MKAIHEKLKELREDNNLMQKEVADYLDIRCNSYQRYEYGERQIPVDKLVLIAKLYKVSVDYILGLTDDPTPPAKRKESRDAPTLESSLRPSL